MAQKMLNTPEQEAQFRADLEKVQAVHARESGVEGPFIDILLPLVKKFGPGAWKLLLEILTKVPAPAEPDTAQP